MNHSATSTEINRRSWLKAAGLLGSASLVGSSAAFAGTTPDYPRNKRVRGIVFMVSDGMSPGVLTLANHWSLHKRQRETRWWQLLNDKSAARGLMDTASANSIVTDSAAASSSWGGGQRINNSAINFSPDGKEITPIAAILKNQSKAKVGLVTTATVTHATPAGFASAVPARSAQADIAPQYLNRVDVILGGGTPFFSAHGRPDKRNLNADFAKAGYRVVHHRNDMLAARDEKLLGTFSKGHLPFSIDRLASPKLTARIPTLSEMASAALDRFLPGDTPFLLQVEGARIDHAAHLNDIGGLLGDQLDFDDALATVLDRIAGRDDILVVVTSDHGNANPGLRGMGAAYADTNKHFATIANSTSSYERILAEWRNLPQRNPSSLTHLIADRLGIQLTSVESDALFEVLGGHEILEWNHQHQNPEGLIGQIIGNHNGIGWNGISHTSDPTIVSAIGPESQRFSGMVINTDVFKHLTELLA